MKQIVFLNERGSYKKVVNNIKFCLNDFEN